MSSNRTCYTQGLPCEILLVILEKNADMFENKDALKMTVRNSQVCREWRDAILSRPTLWGKLIDFDILFLAHSVNQQVQEWWADELIRRSGESLIWIRADVSRYSQGLIPTLLRIIGQTWYRIEKLVVRGSYAVITSLDKAESSRQWSFLTLPAPHIQTFDIFRPWDFSVGTADDNALFSHHAPKLQHFTSNGLRFSVKAPWLRQLRSLHARLNIFELFTVLGTTSGLLHLELVKLYIPRDASAASLSALNFTTLHLPKLESLKLSSSLEAYIIFLQHLVTPYSCSLKSTLSVFSFRPNCEEEEKEEEARTAFLLLAQRARRFFEINKPNAITVRYVQGDVLMFMDHLSQKQSTFSIYRAYPTECEFRTLLMQMAIPELAAVTDLRLDMGGYNYSYEVYETILSFLACLPRVKALNIHHKDLDYFQKLSCSKVMTNKALANTGTTGDGISPKSANYDKKDICLPSLSVLNIGMERGYSDLQNRKNNSPLYEFIKLRKNMSCPIANLRLNDTQKWALLDYSFLEEFTGLTVLHVYHGFDGDLKTEYVCGSGNPRILDFRGD